MSTKDWPALPSEDDWRSDFEDAVMRSDEALSIRLRDTAAALTAVVDRIGMSHDDQCSFMLASAYRRSAGNPHCDCRTQAILRDAREILARLKEEGWI